MAETKYCNLEKNHGGDHAYNNDDSTPDLCNASMTFEDNGDGTFTGSDSQTYQQVAGKGLILMGG